MIKFLSICLFCVFALNSNAQVSERKALDLTFHQNTIELGKITRGDKKTTQFKFTNTGTETLEIDLVSGCECTTLDWTYGQIGPGEKGVIDVIFDSTEKEESGDVEIDIIFKNIDPKVDAPLFRIVKYTFELIEP